jgi:nitrous oxidase accessory protein
MKRKALALTLILALSVLLVVGVQSVKSSPKRIIVPDNYLTIQEAINNASEGDTVFVKRGNYEGPFNQTLVINKTIVLQGESRETTILNLSPPLVPMNIFTYYYMGYLAAIEVNSDNVKISALTINAPGGGISATGSQIQIVDVVATTDLSLKGSWATISQNTIKDGISVTGNANTITLNSIKNDPSFECVGAYNIIANNMMADDDETTTVKLTIEGTNNFISNNTLNSIELEGHNNTISQNYFKVPPGYFGIYLSQSSRNIIHENIITYDGSLTYQQDGIGLTSSYDNVVYANYLESLHMGVYLDNSGTTNNTIYQNNFVNNQFQAWIGRIGQNNNRFDNGKKGNYWSDYNGTDNDGDGIGDTPYIIDANNKDNYPLMKPVSILSPSMPIPLPTVIPSTSPSPSPSPSPTPSPIVTPTTSPSSSPSPSPTPAPNQEPQQTELLEMILAVALIVTAIGVGLLFYLKNRKR